MIKGKGQIEITYLGNRDISEQRAHEEHVTFRSLNCKAKVLTQTTDVNSLDKAPQI